MSEVAPANSYTAKEGRQIEGVTRPPGLIFQDVRSKDANPGPDAVYKEFTVAGESFELPNSWYFSEDFAQQEKEKLWSQAWIFACRVEKIPEVGSCYVHNFLDHSVLVVRSAEDEFRAFRNTCRHRGNVLRPAGSCSKINNFFCPFHGATWHLDGSLRTWPYEFDFPQLEEEDYGLNKVALAEFKGFLFVNMSDNPIPFDDYVQPLREMLSDIPMEHWFPTAHMRKRLRCNWKIAKQAFQEAIHSPVVHPQARDFTLSGGTQIDSPGKFTRRLINPTIVPTDQHDRVLDEAGLLEAVFKMQGIEPPQSALDGVASGMRARDIVAMGTIAQIKEATGVDVSSRATTAIIDPNVYHIFPAFHTNVAANAPFAMFYAPTETPDECYFDMIWFQEALPGSPKPPHPERIDVAVDQTWHECAPDQFLGAVGADVLDQDTENMEGQQQGVKATPDGVSVFANYGESMIINDMKLLQEFLEAP